MGGTRNRTTRSFSQRGIHYYHLGNYGTDFRLWRYLVINTGTTIITFLMVFLIQNTQNRDTEALQVKLDELIRSMKNASNELLDLEELDEKRLDSIRNNYENLARRARGEPEQN